MLAAPPASPSADAGGKPRAAPRPAQSSRHAPQLLNSVGAPAATPEPCPTQPAVILSTYSATGRRLTRGGSFRGASPASVVTAAVETSTADVNAILKFTMPLLLLLQPLERSYLGFLRSKQ